MGKWGFALQWHRESNQIIYYSEQIKEATITSVDFYAKRQSMYDADYSNQRKNKSKGLKYILILIIYRSSEILI